MHSIGRDSRRGRVNGSSFVLMASVCILGWSQSPGDAAGQPSVQEQDIHATPEQAKAFIEGMLEQHGNASCNVPDDTGTVASETMGFKALAAISGDRMTIQQTTVDHKKYKKGFSEDDVSTHVISFLLSEVRADVRGDTGISYAGCPLPARIVIECKTGACVKVADIDKDATDAVSVFDNKPMTYHDVKHQRTDEEAAVPINDESIAHRVVRAIQFYQTHSLAASSPF